jgi:hypothetical protein
LRPTRTGSTSWHLFASTAAIVEFCDGTAGTPMFQVQVPAGGSASQSYPKPINFPRGLHVELVSGTLTRGAIDLV